MKLIGLTGLAGSGKDTVGEYLRDHYGFYPISFADTLKDCLSVIFSWERVKLEGRTPEDRMWRETVDQWWAKKLDIPHFTPRFAMTAFGTEMRHLFHDNLWVDTTERKIAQSGSDKIVITDLRFPTEMNMVRNMGGTVHRIRRGSDPIWGNMALRAREGDHRAIAALKDVYHIHESEWLLYDEAVDSIIYNDTGLDDLFLQCDSLVSTLSITA